MRNFSKLIITSKRCLLIIVGVLFFSFGVFSQTINLNSYWSGSDGFLKLTRQNNNILYFSGGDSHEGGMELTLKKTEKPNCYKVINNPGGHDPWYIKINQTVCLEKISNQDVMVVYDEKGKMTNHFIRVQDSDYETKQKIFAKINCDLAGEYTDLKTGKKYTFQPNQQTASGFGTKTTYEFANDFAFYDNAFSFDGKNYFYYEKVYPNGLDLYDAIADENNFVEKGTKLLYQLRNRQPISTNSDVIVNGLYPFASTGIIYLETLYLSKSELRLARNEIFARHGYRFKSADLKQYFEKQPWYKPLYDNVDDKLTEIEKFNIKVLQLEESNK